MLLSMTGYGESRCLRNDLSVSVEVRTINSRYLKVSVRSGDGYNVLEPLVEGVVRERIHRATVQVNLRLNRQASADDYKVNVSVLDGYRRQLSAAYQEWNLAESVPIPSLLLLPGVVSETSSASFDPMVDWPIVRETLENALANLDRMRAEEGRTMAIDLRNNLRQIGECLQEVERRSPLVGQNYRAKLEERLKRNLADLNVVLEPADIIKEVALFAERSDISEETVRLRSHLDQFDTIMNSKESEGRKLEFLTQEMVREANTIGSKANDVEIARHVIEIKTAVERIREMIQNIE
jgi:uncharacterized protein (TIGR00255 family)